jgi:NDP-sugar pyrophosphorylase family protein
MKPQVILLAGGKGTRLGKLTETYPKPMLNVGGSPWLIQVIRNLRFQGLFDFHISVGFEHEKLIRDLDPLLPGDISVTYHLDEPLSGTGGAIYKIAKSLTGMVLVMNGDSYVADFSIDRLITDYMLAESTLQLATVHMADVNRYGRLSIRDNRVIGFLERGGSSNGFINAGIYLFNLCHLTPSTEEVFSFEGVSLVHFMKQKQLYCTSFNGPFIDIGIPADLKLAEEFKWSK